MKTFDVATLDSIISKLGSNSVQNYILTFGRALSGIKQDATKAHMKEILDYGAEVLVYCIDKNKVSIVNEQKTKLLKLKSGDFNVNKSVKIVVPNIEINSMLESLKKVYEIRTTNKSTLNKDEILHSVDIARIGKKNAELLKQQNNIPLIVRTANLKGSVRIPKNEDSINNPNYVLETKIIQSFMKDYNEQTVFMNHSYDRRGRLYTMSYPLSFQSDEYTRSSFEFAFKQKINENGLKWLMRDIANLAGLDKQTYANKEEWFKDNEASIIKVGTIGKIDRRLAICKELDKPIRFASACKAYVDYLNNRPSGYMCSIDSTASGSQLIALISRDEKAARFTNLTNEKHRYDIYTEVAREFYKIKGETNPLKHLVDRKRFKESCMISNYNGKTILEKHFPAEGEKALFYKALGNTAPKSEALANLINKAYLDNADKPYMAWIMPDGFQVCIPQFKPQWYRVANKHFECLFKYEIIEKDVNQNKRSLHPNFIHSIDSYVCRELLRRLGEEDIEVMSVHDSFYSHPNNISAVLDTYNEILQEINTLKVDILGNFLSDIYGYKVENPFKKDKELDDIRYSRYSLC